MDFLIISPHWSLNTAGNLLYSHIDFILSLYEIDYFMPSPIFSNLQNVSLNYWCCFVCHCELRSNEEGVSRRLYCCARCQWMSVPVHRALPSHYCFSPSSVHFSYSSKQLLSQALFYITSFAYWLELYQYTTGEDFSYCRNDSSRHPQQTLSHWYSFHCHQHCPLLGRFHGNCLWLLPQFLFESLYLPFISLLQCSISY